MRTRLISGSLGCVVAASVSLLQHDAKAAVLGAPIEVIAYAEQDFEYVRVDLSGGSTENVGPLTQDMSVGAFAGSDFSREYAIDYPAGDLYSIDVTTAETTLIGNTGISGASGMAWDPTSNAMMVIAHDPACSSTTLYILDIVTGAAQLIGSEDGCLAGLAIDANDDVFSIDIAAGRLVEDGGAIGFLGAFNFTYVSALFFDPSSDILYLIALDANTGIESMYTVDTITGLATLIAPIGAGVQYSAFALAPPDTSTIFANGFDAAPSLP